ncbi:hypothetical protein EWM64_g9487 [Hericium alpestre]|uniref:Piwi domain-containing protein n=1 Tax=Hericium alpestre TaxID=135208 RepID=A0A4Y9ZID6_9AGAM|nr:hypothetical protein EWM64_g9487 [Hericium alpestre]
MVEFTSPLPNPSRDPSRLGALKMVEDAMGKLIKSGKTSIILVLLSQRDDFIYPGVKRFAAVRFGVQTQCLQLPKALNPDSKKQDQYFSNVALKVNTKLGGINHRLDQNAHQLVDEDPDDDGGDRCNPSESNHADKDFVQFPASLRLQKSKQEGIAELADMMIERLQLFIRRNKTLPQRVLIFRDGVSEGQYDKVLREELPQVFEAFKRIDPKNPTYHPLLSIVICGKRHHARFYASDSKDADKNGNTKPGTVVDKGITSIFDFDFYLQAHAGLQGTVRPTHYVVIYDEIGLGADEIQQGVHTTSYLYARATKAVSLIPAAYYADVVCEQARYWIHGFLNQGSDTASSSGASASGTAGGRAAREAAEQRTYAAAQRMWGNGLHQNLKDTMFYL